MSSVEEFAHTAREFSEWCLSRPGEEPEEARTALSLLLRLYAHALALQFPKITDDDLDGESADGEEEIKKRLRGLGYIS